MRQDNCERQKSAASMNNFCEKLTSHIEHCIRDNPDGAFSRQFLYNEKEQKKIFYEDTDPLKEDRFSPVSRLVHRYRDRVLVLLTGICAAHCRYCFRKGILSPDMKPLMDEDITPMLEYLAGHDEVHEILFSGGDPLTISPAKLSHLLHRFREQSRRRVFRISTRIPFVDPERVTDELINSIRAVSPVWLIVHCNHPEELTAKAVEVLERCISAGIPVVSQTVLLKGINDSIPVLENLFHRLLETGIKPYYLFQGDLAAGTSHFRVELSEGRALVKELRKRISGLAMPVYTVDLPDGGGKIPLTESYLIGETASSYQFRSLNGNGHEYPKEN